MAAKKAKRARKIAKILLAGAFAATLAFGAVATPQPATPPAYAVDLPTWDDVQAAKANEAAKAQKIEEIKGLIAANQKQMEGLQAEASRAAEAADNARKDLQKVDEKLKALKKQAEENQKLAANMKKQIATVVSQMYRSGGGGQELDLFMHANKGKTDDFLARMAVLEKAMERNTKASNEAVAVANSAASLGEQVKTAQEERQKLWKLAETASHEAARNVDAMRERQIKTEQDRKVLEAQLAALQDETAKTVAGYEERLRIEAEERRKREEAARKAAEEARKAAEEAAAARAAAAAANTNTGGGGGGYVPPLAPPVAAGAWGRPLNNYYISSPWGCYPGHQGTDLATAKCHP
ncbi:MAG: M23 family peptidase, partial [Microbacteriaceae bacterium]|nr:M23 family peptidase [Microbacteriaceae bacterium]